MLTNELITIIPLSDKHLEPARQLRTSPDTYMYLTSVMPINKAQQEAWFKRISSIDTVIYFSVTDKSDNFIGIVRCDEWDKVNGSIRIGVDIVKEKRRKGYATMAYKLLLSYFFEQLRINRVWLLVAEYNGAAINLYQKLGFKKEGVQRDALYRNNEYHDYVMMSLLKDENEKNGK